MTPDAVDIFVDTLAREDLDALALALMRDGDALDVRSLVVLGTIIQELAAMMRTELDAK